MKKTSRNQRRKQPTLANPIYLFCNTSNYLNHSLIKNFFVLLKYRVLCGDFFESINLLALKIKEYVDWYSLGRIKTKLNGLSSVKHRQQTA
ncbi:IS3 family transposase [Dolosicoccus paucivorans]|uniref:Integrase catalytic domain-containing protein n=1 Tax=Dolosicoccus paucivorans TaxID=84521 RepID=A0A2N6SPK5_9LACT|nr:hypothetical protein CJ206_00635 [Dolosicoccus paucivorans]PMC58997.1 hypothetical protein CJ205_01450 [Dolosicoccus paucivorans]